MIKVCMNFYNEVKYMPAFIQGIKNNEKKISDVICVDGPTVGYPYIQDSRSNDGSAELLKDAGFKVIEQDYVFLNQANKRNRWLQELNDGDAYLSMDADEELISIKPFEGKTGYVLLEFTNGEHVLAPRLITYEKPMQYVTHTLVCKGRMPYLDLCFIPGTLNKTVECSYNATIKNYRPTHNDMTMQIYKSKIRAAENIYSQLVRL